MSQLTEFIVVLRPVRPEMLRTGPTPQEVDVIGRHFAYLQQLCRTGMVLLAGRTTTEDEHTFGICIYRAGSSTAAEMLMRADPAVAEGVMSATLQPFRIALVNPSAIALPPST